MRGIPFTLNGEKYLIAFQYPRELDLANYGVAPISTLCYILPDIGKEAVLAGEEEPEPVAVGVSICHPNDIFVKALGRIHALRKALESWDETKDEFLIEANKFHKDGSPVVAKDEKGKPIVTFSRKLQRRAVFAQYEKRGEPQSPPAAGEIAVVVAS